MKLRFLSPLMIANFLVFNIAHAETGAKKGEDGFSGPFRIKLLDYNVYAAIDDKETDTDQNDPDAISIKNPDKTSPYFEVGLSKRY